MPSKDFTNLLIVKVSKDEIEKKHPEYIEYLGPVKFIKNDFKENLKDIFMEKIWQTAKERNYYLYDEVLIYEVKDYFVGIALACPRFIPNTAKKLKPPKLTPDEAFQLIMDKLKNIEVIGYSSEGLLSQNQNATTTNLNNTLQ
jgi:hypothetical protein